MCAVNKKLTKYSEKCKILSNVEVYVSDKEVASTVKNVPNDGKSIERFNKYKFAIKSL